ncbi:hypothetical protein [Vreelandella populi]|uniref:Uncharacterized protein n=1 Tax=Vreelandella populi TaxID=2498858 RepID=A0A433LG19_9GAMM|nr:hypothetical protein [Halomonas populi]RUR48832.1 hypothetical protein ELY37_02990 [Halomonas populi]
MAIHEQYRNEFEQWYADQMSADTGGKHTAEEIAKMRKENGFYGGHRQYLNGCWVGFCAGKNGKAEAIKPERIDG